MYGATTTSKTREIRLAPGLSKIIDAAEAAGWSVRREASFVEIVKPIGRTDTPSGYTINSKWWCRGLNEGNGKSFRVTALTLLDLLGLTFEDTADNAQIVVFNRIP